MPRLAHAACAAPLVLSLLAAPAVAQPVAAAEGPPGMCDCAAPAVAVVAAAPALPRWSVGLALTSLSLSPKSAPDDRSQWGGGGVEVGFRVFPHWELGLDLGGADEHVADGATGRHLADAMLIAKWHLAPYARWDFYALAGAGSAAITADASAAKDAKADRAIGALGIGVERRFGHLGISAELRAVGISPVNTDDTGAQAGAMPLVAGTTSTNPPASADDGYGGGSFSLAASYEF